jgi:hypothetical protein
MIGSLLAMEKLEAVISVRVTLYPFVLDECGPWMENPPDFVSKFSRS